MLFLEIWTAQEVEAPAASGAPDGRSDVVEDVARRRQDYVVLCSLLTTT